MTETRRKTVEHQVVETVRAAGEGLRPTEVQQRVGSSGVKVSEARIAIQRLVDDGEIRVGPDLKMRIRST